MSANIFCIQACGWGLPWWLSWYLSIAAKAGDKRNVGLISGLGKSPGEGNGNLLQYFDWKIPWTEEPGRLQSMRLQRVGHEWGSRHTPWHTPPTHTHTQSVAPVQVNSTLWASVSLSIKWGQCDCVMVKWEWKIKCQFMDKLLNWTNPSKFHQWLICVYPGH